MADAIVAWVDVPGTEGVYQASTFGHIRSVDRTVYRMSRWGFEVPMRVRGKELSPWKDSNGYLAVYICANGGQKATNVHRLVARAFLGEFPAWTEVNHLDGVKTNNAPSNLEFVTRKENMEHARALGLHDPKAKRRSGNCKRMKATPINGGEPRFFESGAEAGVALGKGRGNISSAAIGGLRQAYGYFWEYI